MSQRTQKWWLAGLVLAAICSGSARAEEMVDNPMYQDWSRFKVGTSVTYKQEMVAMGQNMEMTLTTKLTALDKDKAVLEQSTSMNMMGQVHSMPAHAITIPAKYARGSQEEQKVKQEEMPKIKVQGGKETIEAAGQKFDCTWGEAEMVKDGMKMTGKTWTCPKVPGGMVKSEMKGDMEGQPISMKMTLVELKTAP